MQTEMSQWELLLVIGIGVIAGYFLHMGIHKDNKIGYVENTEYRRAIMVNVDGQLVRLSYMDKWEGK